MEKLLSVVVPIKNNYEYLEAIIRKVCEIESSELELVIHDNTEDNNQILHILNKYSNTNIKYYHVIKSLPMSQNFEEGIKVAKGKYVCILGADDNISSSIIDTTRYMDKCGIESAVFRKASYKWPGVKYRAHQNRPNLTIYKSNGLIEEIDIDNEFRMVMNNGCISLGKLPEPYHGIVLKDCLEKVKNISGSYVPAGCPDMSMAIALSQVVKKHIFIDAPITISGQSYNSAGGKGTRGEHKGDLKNKSFLPSNVEEMWPKFIPKIWTSPTIYADSMYNTLIAMGCEDKLKYFNITMNYANIISFFPEYLELMKPYIKDNQIKKTKIISYSFGVFTERTKNYIRNWLATNLKISTNKIFFNVSSSLEASYLVDKYIYSEIKDAPYF